MSDSSVDPSGNTEQFRAFAQREAEPPAPARPKTALIAGVAAAIIVVLAVVVLLAVS